MILDFNELLAKEDIQDIIAPLFDLRLNTNACYDNETIAKKALEMIELLDSAIYCETNLPCAKFRTIDEDNSTGAYFSHDRKANVSIISFNIKNCHSAISYLSSYLHEKVHQFQKVSVIKGNEDISEEILTKWKEATTYINSGAAPIDRYNTLELDAYYNQLVALESIKNHYNEGAFTNRKHIYLKAVQNNYLKDLLDAKINNTKSVVEDIVKNRLKVLTFEDNADLYCFQVEKGLIKR